MSTPWLPFAFGVLSGVCLFAIVLFGVYQVTDVSILHFVVKTLF